MNTDAATATEGPERLVEIFRSGRHIATDGNHVEFSDADLRLTAVAFDPRVAPAPLVLGHPPSNGPALGDTVSLSVVSSSLVAMVRPCAELVRLVRSGAYRKISASFYSPVDSRNPVRGVWYLRHIGFLGAMPPSVKGMASPQFAESSHLVVCFAESGRARAPNPDPSNYGMSARYALHNTALRFQGDCPGLPYLDAVRLAESIHI